MGADGHIICARRTEWDKANPDVAPDEIGLYTGNILGVEAVWGYAGDNLMGCGHLEWNNFGTFLQYPPKETSESFERRKAALAWFDTNAEWHEVWT